MPQLRGGIRDQLEFIRSDPTLRVVRWFTNPDPRPEPNSPALPDEGEDYIGAFAKDHNWLQQWTVFGAESDYDSRNPENSPLSASPAARPAPRSLATCWAPRPGMRPAPASSKP